MSNKIDALSARIDMVDAKIDVVEKRLGEKLIQKIETAKKDTIIVSATITVTSISIAATSLAWFINTMFAIHFPH